jgi:hypothetical protein
MPRVECTRILCNSSSPGKAKVCPRRLSSVVYFSLIVPLSCLLLSGGEESQCDGLCFREKAISQKFYIKNTDRVCSLVLFISL